MDNNTYNKKYSKTVKPRYLRDYKKEGLYIITIDKAVFEVSLKHIKCNYKNVTVTKQGKVYVIIARVRQGAKRKILKEIYRIGLIIFHTLTFKVFTIKIKGIDY